MPLAISDFLVDKAGHRLFDISRHVASYLKKLIHLLLPDEYMGGMCPSESRNSMFAQSVKGDEDQLSLRLGMNEPKQANDLNEPKQANELLLNKRPAKRPDMRSPSPGRTPTKAGT